MTFLEAVDDIWPNLRWYVRANLRLWPLNLALGVASLSYHFHPGASR